MVWPLVQKGNRANETRVNRDPTVVIIVPFVSFSLFRVFILSVCFFLSLVFSPLSLSFFHVFCLCLFLFFLLSFSFFVSYCFSFFLDLPSFAWFSLNLRISFPHPSPLPSFPYLSSSFSFPLWVILLSPLVPLSRLLSRFSVPFSSACITVAFSLSFPPISLFLVCLRFFPSPFFSPSC